jgi:hypothetical protein
MDRPDRICPFASARWGMFHADAFGRALVEWVSPLEMP